MVWRRLGFASLLLVWLLPASAAAQYVIGPGPGGTAPIQFIEPTGTRTIDAFPGFLGGMSVTLGDVDGDGVADVIAGAGPGGGPHVRVFSGTDLSELASFFAFDPAFVGGITVAAGDVNGDGRADIIVGAGPGGGPHVRVFSGTDLSELASFFAFDPAFVGGITVAAGDVNGDGRADIVTGAGAGGGPHVRVFSGVDLSDLASFFAYDPAFDGGVNVAAGDIDGDGLSDIVTAAGPGGGPHVRVFSGLDLSEVASFFAFDPAFGGGVRVATGDIDGDGRVDLIIGALDPHVRILSGVDLSEIDSFFTAPELGAGISIGSTGDPMGLRFTSPATTTFTVGSAGTFTVTTSGNPVPAITQTGTLPAGVTFTDNGDGTATLAGTPGAGTGGSYPVTFTANNGGPTSPTQSFTLTVNQAPAFTSATATNFTTGAPGTFAVTTTGFPLPAITRTGATLPAGVTWVDNGNGTGTLSGTPDASAAGDHIITFTADNGVGPAATQTFTLTISGAPTITSPAATTFTVGSAGTFTVTTVATPTATLTVSGALPPNVTFTANADGTGTLAGTPAAGTGGTYPLTFTAANSVGSATQTFTLTVNEAPAITSGTTATFVIGTPGSFTVTTSGFPAATITLGGAPLPTPLTLVDTGTGTATLSGTPGPGTAGTYALTFTANNGVGGNVVQNFVLTVNGPSAFTSAPATTFTVGVAGSFAVTAGGTPTPTITLTSGTLPSGVMFTSGTSTGTLSGTPAAGTGGLHPLTFTASNGIPPDSTQAFTLTVNEAPAITSANATTFTAGTAGSFTVVMTGFPAPTVSVTAGTLPAGVTLSAAGVLSGTPDPGTGGVHNVTLTATNAVGANAVQAFALTVNQAPAITSANTVSFTLNTAATPFQVVMTGFPAPTVSVTAGTLPTGLTLSSAGVLSGTPTQSGSFPVTLTATNGTLPDATQTFTVVVNAAPAITSGTATTFTVGVAGTFTVTTSGFPVPSLTIGGAALPANVQFVDNGNGTGTLSGTPVAGTGGTYAISFTAANGIAPNATQAFVLTIAEPPAITSPNTATFTLNTAGTFQVVMTGLPVPTVSVTSGVLPTGLTLSAAGLLSGTPTQSGSFPVTLTATNGTLPDATQAFTVIVNAPPAITSANATTFTVGTAGSFTVVMTGFPAPTVSVTAGTLPAGVTLSPAGVLSGTPDPGTGGVYNLTLTATNGIGANAVQAFTLTVNQAPAITSATTATFLVNTAGTTFQVVMTGFPAPTVSVTTGTLPTGLTLSAAGLLSGTPTQSGSFPVTLTATNGVLPNATQAFTVLVNAPPAITSANNTTFTVGTPGTFTVTTTGFPVPTVSQAGTLPAGVTFTPATNVLGGTATQTGAFPLVFTATNAVPPDATQPFTLNVICPAITVNPATAMPEGLYQVAYGPVTFSQTGSTGSTITWSATGLPAGLTIASNTGIVSGTPTTTVLNGAVSVTATDNFGCTGTRNTTITVRPTTDNESYTGGVGNTQYVVGVSPVPATPHVLNADVNNTNVKMGDNGPGTLSVTFPAASANGGVIVEGATDGTFTYTPPVGFTGNDTFTYTLTDGNGVTNTATVTIGLSNLVWYVNTAPPNTNGDGRSHSPFNNLTSAGTASSIVASYIFVHSGGATTPGDLTMDANQILRGQALGLVLNGLTIATGTAPTLTGTVTLAGSTQVGGVNFTPTLQALVANATATGIGIDTVNVTGGTNALSLTNVTGVVNVTNSTFTNATGAEVLISGGTGNVTIGATLTGNAGRLIDIQNRTSGTVTFTGALTDTGTGILLNNNGTSTFSFSAGLTLNGTGTTFTATNSSLGGTLTITGTNTIGATTVPTSGTALNVSNINIGASGLTFRSISANGAASGIVLNNTGTTGGLTVSGNSAGLCGGQVTVNPVGTPATVTAPVTGDCTGGTIQSTSGAGIVLTNTSNVSLTRMRIANAGNDGIQGQNVSGFSLIASLVENNGDAVAEANLDFGDTQSVTPDGLHGTGAITNSTIRGGAERNLSIRNSGGAALTAFNVMGSQFSNNSSELGSDDGILMDGTGTAVMTIDVQNSYFAANRGDHFQAAASNSADLNVKFRNNTLAGGHTTALGQGITINAATGVAFGGYTGTVNYDIDSNTINSAILSAITVNLGTSGAAGVFNGFVRNNVIGTTGVADSGSAQGFGLAIDAHGNGTHTLSVTGNIIREAFDRAISVLANDGGGVLNLTVQSNNLGVSSNPAGSRESFFLNNGSTTTNVFGEVDHHTVRLNLGGAGALANTLTHGVGAPDDFRIRQRFDSRIEMPGYAGGPFDTAAVVAYVQGRNTGSAGEPGSATINDSATVTTDGFFTGTVPTPTPF